MRDIKPGDYVDVRCVALDAEGNLVHVRLPGRSAVHQIAIDAHLVQHVEPRSPDAVAADVVFNSYPARKPIPSRRAK